MRVTNGITLGWPENRVKLNSAEQTHVSLNPSQREGLGDSVSLRFGSLDAGTEATIGRLFQAGRMLEAAQAISGLENEDKILHWLTLFNEVEKDPMMSAAAARAIQSINTPEKILKAVALFTAPCKGGMAAAPYNAVQAALFNDSWDELTPRKELQKDAAFRKQLDTVIGQMCSELDGLEKPNAAENKPRQAVVYAGIRAIEMGCFSDTAQRDAILTRLAESSNTAVALKAGDVKATLEDGKFRLSVPPEYQLG
jgi:hypothetical protein